MLLKNVIWLIYINPLIVSLVIIVLLLILIKVFYILKILWLASSEWSVSWAFNLLHKWVVFDVVC